MSSVAEVYLVDDHPLFRQGLAGLINRQADLNVCGEADTVAEAVDGMLKSRPDLAVVDLSLKGASGLDLIKMIRTQHPQTGIVVLSMHDEPHYAERAMRAGARGYVVKSESPNAVVDALRAVLGGKTHLSEEMRSMVVDRFVEGTPAATPLPQDVLSKREFEVFKLMGRGNDTRHVAEAMGLSIKTVQAFCAKAKEKLHLSSATELFREAVRWTEANPAD